MNIKYYITTNLKQTYLCNNCAAQKNVKYDTENLVWNFSIYDKSSLLSLLYDNHIIIKCYININLFICLLFIRNITYDINL